MFRIAAGVVREFRKRGNGASACFRASSTLVTPGRAVPAPSSSIAASAAFLSRAPSPILPGQVDIVPTRASKADSCPSKCFF